MQYRKKEHLRQKEILGKTHLVKLNLGAGEGVEDTKNIHISRELTANFRSIKGRWDYRLLEMSGAAIQEKAFTEQIRSITIFFQIKKIYLKIFNSKYHFWQAATKNPFQNKKLATTENL